MLAIRRAKVVGPPACPVQGAQMPVARAHHFDSKHVARGVGWEGSGRAKDGLCAQGWGIDFVALQGHVCNPRLRMVVQEVAVVDGHLPPVWVGLAEGSKEPVPDGGRAVVDRCPERLAPAEGPFVGHRPPDVRKRREPGRQVSQVELVVRGVVWVVLTRLAPTHAIKPPMTRVVRVEHDNVCNHPHMDGVRLSNSVLIKVYSILMANFTACHIYVL